jgi:hypothetical protein
MGGFEPGYSHAPAVTAASTSHQSAPTYYASTGLEAGHGGPTYTGVLASPFRRPRSRAVPDQTTGDSILGYPNAQSVRHDSHSYPRAPTYASTGFGADHGEWHAGNLEAQFQSPAARHAVPSHNLAVENGGLTYVGSLGSASQRPGAQHHFRSRHLGVNRHGRTVGREALAVWSASVYPHSSFNPVVPQPENGPAHRRSLSPTEAVWSMGRSNAASSVREEAFLVTEGGSSTVPRNAGVWHFQDLQANVLEAPAPPTKASQATDQEHGEEVEENPLSEEQFWDRARTGEVVTFVGKEQPWHPEHGVRYNFVPVRKMITLENTGAHLEFKPNFGER